MQKKTNKNNRKNTIIIIMCTVPSNENCLGIKIAEHLINAKLASCVKIIPNIISIYKWKNKTEKSNEIQLIIKSHVSLQNSIFKYIKNNHPYKIPELITIPTVDIETKYLSWTLNSLNKQNWLTSQKLHNYKKSPKYQDNTKIKKQKTKHKIIKLTNS